MRSTSCPVNEKMGEIIGKGAVGSASFRSIVSRNKQANLTYSSKIYVHKDQPSIHIIGLGLVATLYFFMILTLTLIHNADMYN